MMRDARYNLDQTHMMGDPNDDLHLKRNFELCRAINLTSLTCVLNDMVETGHLHKDLADLFKTQAEALLHTIRSENNRSLGF